MSPIEDTVGSGSRRSFEALRKRKYVNLMTFRKSGEAVATPVWFVLVEGRIYVQTDPDSGKVKRIRNNPRVVLTLSTPWGRPRGAGIEGVAWIVEGEEHERVQLALLKKYRLELAVAHLFGALNEFDGRPTLEIRPAVEEALT